MWLAVAGQDAERAAQVIRGNWARHLDPEALAAAECTVDLDAESAACPACGEAFAPSDLRCTSCGLRFG